MKILIEESVLRQALDALFATPESSLSLTRALRTALDAAEKVEPVGMVKRNHSGQMFVSWVGDQTIAMLNLIDKPLYTHPAPATPEGWQLIPKLVTPEMEHVYSNDTGAYQSAQELHDAMLAAAPAVPELGADKTGEK